jgi:hypothetical protein
LVLPYRHQTGFDHETRRATARAGCRAGTSK